jgi:protein tyrosine/serine phosphatase
LGLVAVTLAGLAGIGLHLFLPPAAGNSPQASPPAAESSPPASVAGAARPAKWAVAMDLPGCPNLHRLAPGVYRGAQPTAEGMKELKKLGVRTIVNLRSFHSDRDEMKAAGVEFDYEHITMKAWHAEDKEIVRFLRIATDEKRRPVFFHCQHGADRTGTMCASYRIAVQGWDKKEAMREMQEGGYGFHGVWQNLLRYIQELDFEEIKRRVKTSE